MIDLIYLINSFDDFILLLIQINFLQAYPKKFMVKKLSLLAKVRVSDISLKTRFLNLAYKLS